MGVIIDTSQLDTVNLLTELEIARQNLSSKANDVRGEINEEDNNDLSSEEDNNENLEGIEEETSEIDGFALVLSKRDRKATKRLSLSGKKQKKKCNKGDTCITKNQRWEGTERPWNLQKPLPKQKEV
jgi:hypothetical protein